MASPAILRVKSEGGSDAKKLIEDLTKVYVDAQEKMGKAAKATAQEIAKEVKAATALILRTEKDAGAARLKTEKEVLAQLLRVEKETAAARVAAEKAAGAEILKSEQQLGAQRVKTEKAVGEEVAKSARGTAKAREKGEKEAKQRTIVAAMESTRAVVRETAKQGEGYRGAAVTAERAEKLITRAKLRELALQGAAQKTFIERYRAALKLATAAMEAEVGKRGQLSEREKRQVETVALAMVAAHEQAERQKTRTTEREFRQRQRLQGQGVREAGRQVANVGRAGVQFAGDVHGQMQAARADRANVDHTINGALFQAGITGTEATEARAEVHRRAHAMGMDPAVLAESLFEAQKQFSVLSGRTPEARRAALGQQMELAQFAQSTYQDPQEVTRVAGMLGQQGIHGAAQRQTLLSMTGIANAGAVELRDIVARGLGPMMQNITIARGRLGPNATPAQTSAAVQEATLRTMAMQEVASRGGGNIRASMNAFAAMERGMTNTRTATNLRGALEHRRFTPAQIGTVLTRTRDPRSGRTEDRFRSTDSLEMLSNLNGLFGNDTAALTNALSAGGHGLPTTFLSNIRTLMGILNSQTEGGETVQQRVTRMRREGTQFTEANVEAGRKMVQGEEGTKIERQRQDRQNELLGGNNAALNRLSDQLAAFANRNPLTTAAAPTVGAAGGGALAWLTGALLGVGTVAGGAIAAGGALATTGARNNAQGRNLAGEEFSLGDKIGRGAINSSPLGQAAIGAYDLYRGFQARGLDGLLQALPASFARELQAHPLTVVVPPNAGVHHDNQSATTRQNGGS